MPGITRLPQDGRAIPRYRDDSAEHSSKPAETLLFRAEPLPLPFFDVYLSLAGGFRAHEALRITRRVTNRSRATNRIV